MTYYLVYTRMYRQLNYITYKQNQEYFLMVMVILLLWYK